MKNYLAVSIISFLLCMIFFKTANSDYNDICVLCDEDVLLLLLFLACIPAVITQLLRWWHFDTALWHSDLVFPTAWKAKLGKVCGTLESREVAHYCAERKSAQDFLLTALDSLQLIDHEISKKHF